MKKTTFSHGTIYITISTFVFVASGYFLNIWLGRYLGPASYGIYGVIITLITVINLTQASGLPLALAKFIAEDENHAGSILKRGLIIQSISTVVATVLLLLLAYPIALLLNDVSLVPYILLSAGVIPLFGIYSVYLSYYNGLNDFKTQALMSIVYAITKFLAIILFVNFYKVYGAIIGFIVAPLIVLLIWFRLPRNIKYHFSYKKIILFSLPLIAFAIFLNLLQSVDLFFVKSLLDADKSTGFYTANQNIAELPFYAVTALASVLYPSISRSVSHNLNDQTKKLILKSLRYSLLILSPGVFLISASSFQILEFIYSTAYQPGSTSLSILVLGSGFFTFFVILTTIISSSGSPLKSAIIALIGVLLSSLLCVILIPPFGLSGAAFATTISSGIVMCASGILVYKKFHVLFSIKSVINIVLASLIIFFLARYISVPNLFLPILYLFLFLVYVTLLFILKEITSEDIALIKSLIPKRLTNRFKKLITYFLC